MSDIANALSGMLPQQSQQATQMAIGALQRNREQNLAERAQKSNEYFKSKNLELMQNQEARLKTQAQFDRQAKTAELMLSKRANEIRQNLEQSKTKLSDAQTKLAKKEYSQLVDKANRLKSLNQKMKIPGTDGEEISVGAAVEAGIFSDILKEVGNTAGVEYKDYPSNVKEFIYLKDELGKSDSEAIRTAFGEDKTDLLLKLMTSLNWTSPEEAKEMLGLLRGEEEPTGGNSTEDNQNTSQNNEIISEKEIEKGIKQYRDRTK